MKQSITTKRLVITPMDIAELMQKAELESDAHMKAAYGEMLEGVKAHPGKAIWHTEWRIALKSGESVGGAGFKGAPENGAVEIGYGVDAPHRGCGYAAEAAGALCRWAFRHGAYFVNAEAEADNGASKRVLEACGFACIGMGREGELWEKEKPKTPWLAVCMCLGVSIGCAVGAGLGGPMPGAAVGIAMAAGLAIGAAAGATLDAVDARARKQHALAGSGAAPEAGKEDPAPEAAAEGAQAGTADTEPPAGPVADKAAEPAAGENAKETDAEAPAPDEPAETVETA